LPRPCPAEIALKMHEVGALQFPYVKSSPAYIVACNHGNGPASHPGGVMLLHVVVIAAETLALMSHKLARAKPSRHVACSSIVCTADLSRQMVD
jgi:hypothetical protein